MFSRETFCMACDICDQIWRYNQLACLYVHINGTNFAQSTHCRQGQDKGHPPVHTLAED